MKTTGIIFCLSVLVSTQCAAVRAETSTHTSAIFVADPQIHNIYGYDLWQTSSVANWAISVARRPPELNLTADLILSTLLKRAAATDDTGDPSLIFVLGDGTNIACTNEYHRFQQSFNDWKDSHIVLMAHGNHDSYLMGTVNSYVPTPGALVAPFRAPDAPLPIDESWWRPLTTPPDGAQTSWNAACISPDGGQPLNKGQWLAKYFAGLDVRLIADDRANEPGKFPFYAEPPTDSKLAQLNFEAEGLWVPPRQLKTATRNPLKKTRQSRSQWNFMSSYSSFAVQAIDLGVYRAIIIDTSVCEFARGGRQFKRTNAGSNGCIGTAQLEVIREFVKKAQRAQKTPIFVGHFPLSDLHDKDRDELISIMSSNEQDWLYISAHKHKVGSFIPHESGTEINIGSTTDWPMEISRIRFKDSLSAPILQTITLSSAAGIAPAYYLPASEQQLRIPELCRHLQAARLLAEAAPDTTGSVKWIPPALVDEAPCSKADWVAMMNELQTLEETIRTRFSQDSPRGYRNFLLSIAAGASRYKNDRKGVLEKFE